MKRLVSQGFLKLAKLRSTVTQILMEEAGFACSIVSMEQLHFGIRIGKVISLVSVLSQANISWVFRNGIAWLVILVSYWYKCKKGLLKLGLFSINFISVALWTIIA